MSIRTITRSAAELGYRMPGEFEVMEAVWLCKPRNRETWPGCFEEASGQHADFVAKLEKVIKVELIGRDHGWRCNDSWIRDYGPIYVVRSGTGVAPVVSPKVEGRNKKGSALGADDGRDARRTRKAASRAKGLAIHDFVFNGWGGKYGNEYAEDDKTPRRIAKLQGVPVWVHKLVLEGGSIEVNGLGTVMTTAQCLLNKNRNPRMTREEIEAEVHAALGTRHCVWLPGGIVGDDTDGHIDDIARFVSPTTVVATRAPKGHADYAVLERNYQTLRGAKDQDGKKMEVVELPAPDPIIYNFPADRFGPGGENPVPASYANFLIANEHVFVPVFGQKNDEKALRIIEKTSGLETVPVRSEYLVVGLGALHCLSMQQPKG